MNENTRNFIATLDLVQGRLVDVSSVVRDLAKYARDNPASLTDGLAISVHVRGPLPGGGPGMPNPGACDTGWIEQAGPLTLAEATTRLVATVRNCADLMTNAAQRAAVAND